MLRSLIHLEFTFHVWYGIGIFKKYFIYLFLERGREEEKHQCVVAFHAPPTGDPACNPGVCPDWELN